VRAILLIAAKDVRQRFRDRSAIVLGFVAPLAIAFLMANAFGGAQDLHVSLGVVDEDGGELAHALVAVLESPDLADLFTVESRALEEARTAVDDGDLDAALVIPEGFSAAVTSGAAAELEVLAGVDTPLSAAVTRSVAEAFLTQVHTTRVAVVTALGAGAPATDLAGLAARAASATPAIPVEAGELGGRELDLLSYYAPGMAIFFALFGIGFTARSWFTEVREGTLDRMAAAPIGRRSVVAGKALSVVVYGTASLGTAAVVTSAAFGARWGPPLAVAAIILAVVVAVVALTALVISVARTEQQAEGLAAILTFALALLGGSFIFLGSAPAALRRAALLTPNGWALRGFTDLSTGAASPTAVGPVLAILTFAAVVAVAAAVLARRGAVR
jgi:ABC-2 type transport system permease protein